jgi:GNAT superfamily N-acetyltransferase
MEIRIATPRDAAALTALHLRSLPHGESDFTQLGAPIVELFYANAVARGVGTAFCAVEDGVVAAFVLVTANVRDLFGRALLAGPRDIAVFAARVSPRGLIGAVRAKLSSHTIVLPDVPEVVYLVVDPPFRGRRLGTVLMERADAWFKAAGLSSYDLNVHVDNEAALKTYFRNGQRVVREYLKDGVRTYTLRKEL